MAKLSEMNDADAAAALLKIYRQCCDSYDPNGPDKHPSQVINDLARSGRRAKDSEGGLGPVLIQNKPKAKDSDPQPSKSAGGNSGNGGNVPAEDDVDAEDGDQDDVDVSAFDSIGTFSRDSAGNPRFVYATGAIVVGDAALVAHARQSSPKSRAKMGRAIKGYDRLR